MCKKKPYPRCSSHAYKKLKSIEAKLESAEKLGCSQKEIIKLKAEYRTAKNDYLITPKGLKSLEQAINHVKEGKISNLTLNTANASFRHYKRKREISILNFEAINNGESRSCKECQKTLTSNQINFCSIPCRKTNSLKTYKKICPDCGKTPAETPFGPNPNTIDKLSSVCRKCNSLRTKKLTMDYDEEKIAEIKARKASDKYKNTYLLRQFGITLEVFHKMKESQNDKCKICSTKFNSENIIQVDHNHDTGKVRALLCRNCNWGIGHFKDSPLLLTKAIEYIRKNKTSQFSPGLLYQKGEGYLRVRGTTDKISKEGKIRLALLQNNRCHICQNELGEAHKTHVDHSHVNGHIRGILCRNCNIGIGNLKDNNIILQRAIKYLEEHDG